MGCNCKESNTKCNCNCPPNEPGPAGKNWIYVSTAEPAGLRCTYGGTLIQGGPDIDGDGVPDQILSTFYVCNGAPSAQYVTKVTAEAAGVNCAYGGYMIQTGIDADNDGTPDSSIVTSYICNGAPGDNATAPVLTAGTVTAVPNGDPLEMAVTEISAGVWRIDLLVPEGPAGTTDSAGVVVTGLTRGTCMDGDLTGITSLTGVLNAIIAKMCTMGAGIANKTMAFQGVQNRDIEGSELNNNCIDDGAGTAYFYVPFPDDSINGYDNGNNFYTDVFTCPISAPDMSLIVENLQFQGVGAGPNFYASIAIQIVKRGATYATDTVIVSTILDIPTGAAGVIVTQNSLTTGVQTLVAGEKYSVRLKTTDAFSYGVFISQFSTILLLGSKFSNNY